MYEFGDLFAISCSSSDFTGRPPEITTTASYPEFFPATVPCYTPAPTTTAAAATASPFVACDEYNSAPVDLSSVPSYSCYYAQRPSLIQRCMSSQSLPNEGFHYPRHNPIFSSLDESAPENFEFEAGPMRKVFSTGDLQMMNLAQQQQYSHGDRSDSPLSQENCVVEGTKKVRCYSAQERKERIERYRSKRSQRNFNKKIKYACRKTLADSRPRIRGRFARNEEIGESIQTQWNQIGGDEDYEEEDDVWVNFLSALSTNLMIP